MLLIPAYRLCPVGPPGQDVRHLPTALTPDQAGAVCETEGVANMAEAAMVTTAEVSSALPWNEFSGRVLPAVVAVLAILVPPSIGAAGSGRQDVAA